jgi:hypothetical protein
MPLAGASQYYEILFSYCLPLVDYLLYVCSSSAGFTERTSLTAKKVTFGVIFLGIGLRHVVQRDLVYNATKTV